MTLLPKPLTEPFSWEKKSFLCSSEKTGASHHSHLLLYSHPHCIISPEKSLFFPLDPPSSLHREMEHPRSIYSISLTPGLCFWGALGSFPELKASSTQGAALHRHHSPQSLPLTLPGHSQRVKTQSFSPGMSLGTFFLAQNPQQELCDPSVQGWGGWKGSTELNSPRALQGVAQAEF